MAEIHFDFATTEPFEIGARITATLACPLGRDAERRENMFLALCSDVGWISKMAGNFSAEEWAAQFPKYTLPKPLIAKHLRTLQSRLDDRAQASRIARGLLWEAISGRQIPLPNGMLRHSLAELYEYVRPNTTEKLAENVKTRIWRESRPVLHLVAAIEAITEASRRGRDGLDAPILLNDEDLHRRALSLAADYEILILQHYEKFHIRSDRLICFRFSG